MKKNFSIRWHSRAGQGALTAANFLAEALAELNYEVQSLPEFDAEKRGALVNCFNRFSLKTNNQFPPTHEKNPDIVVLFDETLIGDELPLQTLLKNLNQNSTLLVNTEKISPEIRKNFSGKIFCIPATKLSLKILNKNIPNIVLVGALIKILNLDTNKIQKILEHKLNQIFSPQITEKNLIMFKSGLELIN